MPPQPSGSPDSGKKRSPLRDRIPVSRLAEFSARLDTRQVVEHGLLQPAVAFRETACLPAVASAKAGLSAAEDWERSSPAVPMPSGRSRLRNRKLQQAVAVHGLRRLNSPGKRHRFSPLMSARKTRLSRRPRGRCIPSTSSSREMSGLEQAGNLHSQAITTPAFGCRG
jgi:hypothetical protein